jgi:DNA-binding beta-propeller fold protein YncE
LWSLLLVVIGTVLVSACTVADVKLTNTPVPSLSGKAGSFDVIQIDQQNHRLYVSDRIDQGIDVFDISSSRPAFLQTISVPSSPNGLAIAPDLGRLYAATAKGSIVFVDIDLKSPTVYTVLREIPTGGKGADLLDYAAGKNLVFVGSGSDGAITSIDATTGEVKGNFKIGAAPEQPRFNPADGMLYVTSPEVSAMFQINPINGMVGKIPLPSCHQPSGMAINPRSNQALVACRSSVMSWDFRTGKAAKVFENVAGGDVVTYDAKVDRFFVAAPKNKPASVVGIFGGNPIDYIGSVATSGGGNSASYDEANDVVYTPDTRPNNAGLTSFRQPVPDQLPTSILSALGILAIVIVGAGLFFFVVARSADPIRRPQPAPAAVPSGQRSQAPH